MRDDLIGYVLGALDSAEQQDIDRRLEQDVALRREVERAKRLIRPLWANGECAPGEASRSDGSEAPPAGLADRTCQCLWDLTGPPRPVPQRQVPPRKLPWPTSSEENRAVPGNTDRGPADINPAEINPAGTTRSDVSRGDTSRGDASRGELERTERFSRNFAFGSAKAPGRDLVPGSQGPVVRPRERLDFSGNARQWTMADFVVAAGVCVAAACLFFPALVNSRYTSQMFACQNNQRELGQRMNEYAMLTGHYPSASASDNTAVAGIYSVLLREKGLLDDTRRLVCPAKGNSAIVIRLPSRQELLSAQGPKLVTYLNTMGGDFAYTLGYLNKGRLQPVRNLGRKHMALLADAPIDNLRNVALTNHVNGQNVLFEDGHVRFLTTRIRPGGRGDDMFLNDHGQEWAGQHAEDVVLGRSGVSPFPAMHPEAALIRVKNGPGNPAPVGNPR